MTIPEIEEFDLYNWDRSPTGETWLRGQPLPQGRYHMVVHICIFNQKGELLIQQRHPNKAGYPNFWDLSAGGSALKGETSWMAAKRETAEELGLKLELDHVRPIMTLNFEDGFDDLYAVQITSELDLSRLHLQPEEVQAVQWASREQIQKMLCSGKFVPYYPSMIDLLFEHGIGYQCLNDPEESKNCY